MTLKTRSGVKKRVKFTGTGKIKVQKACKRHLLMDKAKKAKKKNQYGEILDKSEQKRVIRQMPYAK